MFYISTRGGAERKSSTEVIKQGMAADGGLFVPESIPELSEEDIAQLCKADYIDRAARILGMYLTDYTQDELRQSAQAAYSQEKFGAQPAPVRDLGNYKVLELWHGPTCAFKDMALQIMPRLLSTALEKTRETKTTLILVATSGDTGKAALEGYKDVPGIKIMVFYPQDGVSDIQKLQMTSQDGSNVNVCAIRGNFDDAQTGVKKIFSDPDIKKELADRGYTLSSANSINWGRLAPQIVYYVSAYCDLVNNGSINLGDQVDICVPTGNFGNIFAAYLAKEMGLPVRKLICASNRNNVLTDFILTGAYDRNRTFYTTMSPSMDILISSNLERLLYMTCGADETSECMRLLAQNGSYSISAQAKAKIQSVFGAYYATEEDTLATIKKVFDTYGYLIDTHTAVAMHAAMNSSDGSTPVIVASTASPYKFGADVLRALTGQAQDDGDFFGIIRRLKEVSNTDIPYPIAQLESKTPRFTSCTGKAPEEMMERIRAFL